MLYSVYSAVQRGKQTRIQTLLAYELSLINGCGTHENNICGHFLFEVVLVSSPNIIIVTKKSKQTSVRNYRD